MNRSAARLFVKFLELLPRPGDAAKAQVARRCVDRLRHARRRPVAPAIVRRAQVRSAFHDFAWYAAAPGRQIEALISIAAARVDACAAGMHGLRVRLIPIRGPFPAVAAQVVEAVAVGREAADRSGAFEAVVFEILPGEASLPSVSHVLAGRRELLAPDELGSLESTARGELPYRLGRQLFSEPFGVGDGVLEGDVHDGMARALFDGALRSLGVAPIGAGNVAPPLEAIPEIHRTGGLAEDDGGGHEHLRLRAGIVGGIRRPLGDGDVARRLDESAKIVIRYGVLVDPKTVDRDAVRGRLFGVMTVRSHEKGSTRDPNHVGER